MATTVGRRRFISRVVLGAATWPLAVLAQQQALPVIGFLGYGSAELAATRVLSFRQGVAEAGIIEGRDATIEYRWAEDQNERLPKAGELVSGGVNVLVAAGSTVAALAAKASTTTLPIVFFVGSDPVKLGLVASLNQPGGNITGPRYRRRCLAVPTR
jgi:putative ABC transport system substrate-binding protein